MTTASYGDLIVRLAHKRREVASEQQDELLGVFIIGLEEALKRTLYSFLEENQS